MRLFRNKCGLFQVFGIKTIINNKRSLNIFLNFIQLCTFQSGSKCSRVKAAFLIIFLKKNQNQVWFSDFASKSSLFSMHSMISQNDCTIKYHLKGYTVARFWFLFFSIRRRSTLFFAIIINKSKAVWIMISFHWNVQLVWLNGSQFDVVKNIFYFQFMD